MFAKIEISGVIEVMTGLHIGGSSAFSAIGAVDSPVILDTRSNMPMIPGSSLKGKMRTLLAKKYNEVFARIPDDDNECLLALFGSAKKGAVRTSRVQFSDMFLSNLDELKRGGLTRATEIKFENSISRASVFIPALNVRLRIAMPCLSGADVASFLRRLYIRCAHQMA